eukprot:COSAG04_NODE_501_length_13363_cov_9.158137_9_plen_1203_part_00
MTLGAQLEPLSVRELRDRAAADGADGDRVEAALDEEDAKAALIALILEKATRLDVEALRLMKKPQLRTHASEQGVPAQDLEAARLEDDEKQVLIRILIARADAQGPGEAPSDERYEDIREIQGPKVKLVRNKESGDELVAKTFDSREQFEREKSNLITCKDKKGKEAIIQFKGEFEPGLVLYLEHAPGGSLKELLDDEPDGLDENDVKSKIAKAIAILQYLHGNHDKAHCDFKAENMLLYGRHLNEIRGCDMESASDFGQLRSIYATPYICAPEVARHIIDKGSLRVSAAEDIWAVGVTVLYLLTGKHPFPAETGVEKLASLTQDDVHNALRQSGKVKSKSQLESFLLKCLSVNVGDRAKQVSELQLSGWISGGATTQFVREGGDKINQMGAKLEVMHEDMDAGFQDLKVSIGDVKQGVEAVRKTVVNLDKSEIPAVFVIEPATSLKDSVIEQLKNGEVGAAEEEVKGMFARFKSVFDAESPMDKVQTAVDEFSAKKMTLRLVCQATGQPVGEGYEITAPRETVPKLLPLMEVGLKTMKVLNGAAKMGRMFGIPLPEIPQGCVGTVESLVDGLGAGESGYACVAEAAGEAVKGSSGEAKTALSQFQLAEFRKFLEENDPEGSWKGLLVRVALENGDVLWVSEEGKSQLEEDEQLGPAPPPAEKVQKQKDEKFAQAAQGGDAHEVERLLAKGVSPDAKDGEGEPALGLAAYNGHLAVLKLLQQHGANLEATNAHGATALTFAAWQGKPDCTKALLEWGADVEAASNTTNTSLHLAAAGNGHLECVRLLVVAGADRAKRNREGQTALELAQEGGNAEIVDLLAAADPVAKAQADLSNAKKDENLAQAVVADESQGVERLLAQGVSPDAKNGEGQPGLHMAAWYGHLAVLKLLQQHGAKLEATNAHGATALTFAAWQGKPDCTKALLEWGADVEAASNTTNTSLHLAAMCGHLECVRLLVVAGADRAKRNREGQTALELAQEGGNADIVDLLAAADPVAKAQADLNDMSFGLQGAAPAPDMSAKETELAQAAQKNELQTMERLIAEGASADAKDGRGDPALVLAAVHGHLDALKLLRRHGANLEATDTVGRTALMWAAICGNADCAEALLEWGADKDAASSNGSTALHYAARNGQLECARLLVEARADRARKNKQGKTALEVAREEGKAEVAALLEQADAPSDVSKCHASISTYGSSLFFCVPTF